MKGKKKGLLAAAWIGNKNRVLHTGYMAAFLDIKVLFSRSFVSSHTTLNLPIYYNLEVPSTNNGG